jgi:hypothetical protein
MTTWRETHERTIKSSSVKDEPIKAEHHHSPVDTTTGPAAQIYPGTVSHAETHGAATGQLGATHGMQDPGPFTPSDGMHCTGQDHIDCFEKSINMSGGVRQGHTFTSDPAPGVACASIEPTAASHLDMQNQGSGETFQDRQHKRWANQGG